VNISVHLERKKKQQLRVLLTADVSHHIVQWCHIDLSSLNDRNPYEALQPAYNDILQESEYFYDTCKPAIN